VEYATKRNTRNNNECLVFSYIIRNTLRITMGILPMLKLEIMKFIKIINREYNMVELPCGKVTNSIDIAQLDMNNEIGNLVVRYNNEQKIINKL